MGRPDISRLKKLLLGLGGVRFQVDSFLEADLSPAEVAHLLRSGKTFDGRGSKVVKGMPSRCHDNVASLVMGNPDAHLTAWSGMALSDDGIWRVHSWVVTSDGKVIETTMKRVTYFGCPVPKEEVNLQYDEALLRRYLDG